ncbi:MAG: hypothetical protein MK108_18940 [Mariniblastus sp.]|nr:hypothetical protein [Mariniblastus sp.]
MPKRTWFRLLISMSIFCIGIIAAYLFWRWVIDGGKVGPATPGERTTFVTDPQYIRQDGSISYVRAINDWRSEGVTAENNACVDLMRALGPAQFAPEDWPLAWAAVAGQEVEPPAGPFLSTPPLNTDKEFDEYDQSMERPWRADEFPQLYQHLQTNQAFLDLAVAGSQKEHFYFPLIIPDRADVSLIEVLLPIAMGSRELARSLKMRAMNHLAHGRTQACLDDLIATRRIGHLVSQKGMLIEHLVGTAITHMGIVSEMRAIESGQLTAAQVDDYLAQLESLPEFNNLAECVDRVERLCALDILQSIGYGGGAQLQQLASWTGGNGPETVLPTSFDLNEAMTIMNQVFDEQVEITQAPSYAEQTRQADALNEKLNDLQASSSPVTAGVQAIAGGNRTRGKLMGNVMVTLMVPAVSQVCEAQTRRLAMHRMAHLAFCLEQFRLKNGEYPTTLDDLQLGESASLVDPYSDQRILYELREHGFQLHVVGINMQDDQGVGLEESDGVDKFGDDWKIEIDRSKLTGQSNSVSTEDE